MKLKTLALCSLTMTSLSHAAIENVSYTDTSEGVKSHVGRELQLVNSTSPMTFYISSSIDKKIRITLIHNDIEIETSTSSVVGLADRLSIDDRDFYGKEMIVNSVTQADGLYTLKVEYLNLSDQVITTETYSFTQDTTPPTIGGDFVYIRNAYYGTIDNFGNTGTTKQLEVREVSDAGGISHAKYWARLGEGDKVYGNAQYNENDQKIIISASTAVNSTMVPSPGYYEIGIDLFDKAGNVSTKSRFSHIDLGCPDRSTIIKQIFNEQTQQWEDYVSGVEVHVNPVKTRYGRVKEDFATEESPYGWKMNHMVSDSDEDYVYSHHTFVYPQQYSYFHYYSQSGHVCYTDHYRNFNFTLAAGVDEAPKGTGVWYKTNQSSDWVQSNRNTTNTPLIINGVRLFAETRPYRQMMTVSSGGQCYIEVGDTFCDIDTNYVRETGRGYSPYSTHARKDDGSMAVHFSYLLTYYDFNAPEFNGISYNDESQEIEVKTYDADTTSSWTSGMWVIKSVTGKALLPDGSEVSLPQKAYEWIDHNNRIYTLDVSHLNVEADVIFEFTVTDNYNNSTTVTELYNIDTVSPSLDIRYEGESMPSVIKDIEDISIVVNDFSTASPVSAQLKGSDANEDVYLAIFDNGDGTWSVSKPRIFPTLNFESGERYELIVRARDVQGNETVETVQFGYTPNNLIVVDLQQYITSSGQKLFDIQGNSLAKIYSDEPLALDNGQLATGPQEVELTNRVDSDFSISIDSASGRVVVEPGETKLTTIDLGTIGEPLEVDIYPTGNSEGKAEFLFNIPTLTTIY